MPNPVFESVEAPFTAFRFEVVLTLNAPIPGITEPLCNAAFSDCSGLDMTMEPKTITQGGANTRAYHQPGPVTYGRLTLKRGMTANLQLWDWFAAAARPGRDTKAQGQITMMDSGGTPCIIFMIEDCLPVKMTAPALDAKGGQIAIEELQLVYGMMTVRPAEQSGGSLGVENGAGASASLSVSGGAGVSGSRNVNVGRSFGIG